MTSRSRSDAEQKLHGVIPVVPTPFTDREEVDYDALAGLVQFAVQAGVSGVCLPAYGSEFYKLSELERRRVIETAVKVKKHVKVIAQSNHPSTQGACDLARLHQDLGADVISFAIPRQFALSEDDILRYCAGIASAVTIPVLIQDFNPGGPTVSGQFARHLLEAAPNFRYLKLEEPLMGAKVGAIRKLTKGRIGIFEGWGGMYLLELLSEGITGVMPGLSVCDLFRRVWSLGESGDVKAAAEIYRVLLPFVVFSLQNMELFHHCEKRLLKMRGLLQTTTVREPTLRLDQPTQRYLSLLCRTLLELCERLGFH